MGKRRRYSIVSEEGKIEGRVEKRRHEGEFGEVGMEGRVKT